MKLTGVELRRISMPLVAPFRTSFGTETTRDILLVHVLTDASAAEGWGECVAMSNPLYSSEYVDAAADVLRRFLVPALVALRAGGRARGRRRPGAVQGAPDGQGRAGDGGARRGAARRGAVLRARARRGPRPGPVRGLGRDHGQHPRAARRRRRLPRRGLRPDQAEDRARLGRRAGARGARAVRRRRAAPGGREHGVHPGRRAASWPGWTPSTSSSSSNRSTRRTCSATRTWPDRSGPRSAWTSRSPRHVDAAAAIRLGACRGGQHQARAGRWLPRGAPHPRRVRRARGAGVVRRDAGDRPRPRRQRRSRRPARVHAAGRHLGVRALLRARTSPSRSSSTTVTSACRPAPGWGWRRCPTGSPRSPPRPSG